MACSDRCGTDKRWFVLHPMAVLSAERVVEDVAQQLEAAAPPDLARLRRVDALNGYGIRQEGGHPDGPISLLVHSATAKLASWPGI